MAAKVRGMGEELLHVSTACDMFRVSRRTLYSRIKDGTFKTEVSGGATYLHITELKSHYGELVSRELMKSWRFNPETNGYESIPKADK